jgi:hypothetical protein
MFNTFGNKVKIKISRETEEKGLAGKIGEVHGETTPSVMELEIVGTPSEDYAVNVYFDELEEAFWFDPHLLEYINNGQGSVITLDGVDKKWTKGKNGEWIEEDVERSESTSNVKKDEEIGKQHEKKWWEFWKKKN